MTITMWRGVTMVVTTMVLLQGLGGVLHWRTIPVAGAVVGRCCHGASPVACAVVVIIIQGLRPPSINLSVCLLIVES